MQRVLPIAIIIILGVAAVLAYSSLFTVHQTQHALVLRFGEPIGEVRTPGLNVKMPIADEVVLIDKRVLFLDSPIQEVIASDQKRLVVDAFARYRITNELRFYQSVRTQTNADTRLSTVLNSAVRRVLGDASFEAIVRDDREGLMRRIASQVNREAATFGIEIVDVRIRRADLPEANSQAVYRRMQTERQREANDIRARGEEESQRIRSRADREVTVIKAEAERESQVIRGEGDGERNKLFADAFGRDPDFFAFYRSMQAYESGLSAGDTRMVLTPESDFFRYFQDPFGGQGAPTLPPVETPQEPEEDVSAAESETDDGEQIATEPSQTVQ